MAIETEFASFRSRLQELKAEHEGKFALVQGDRIIDVFSSYEDAVKVGYAQFGLTPFLVKRIQTVEEAQFISRFADPCSVPS